MHLMSGRPAIIGPRIITVVKDLRGRFSAQHIRPLGRICQFHVAIGRIFGSCWCSGTGRISRSSNGLRRGAPGEGNRQLWSPAMRLFLNKARPDRVCGVQIAHGTSWGHTTCHPRPRRTSMWSVASMGWARSPARQPPVPSWPGCWRLRERPETSTRPPT
jgi:hypothetical protein